MSTYYSATFFDDGLSLEDARQRYKKRRQALMLVLDVPTVIIGVQSSQTSPYTWLLNYMPVYQEPSISYLTGLNQPFTALYLNPDTQEEVIFLPKKNPKMEFWEGFQCGVGTPEADQQASHITGISAARPIKELMPFLLEVCKKNNSQTLAAFWNDVQKDQPQIKDENAAFARQLKSFFSKHKHTLNVINMADKLWKIRLCLDDVDIKNMRQANVVTAEALVSTFKAVKQYSNEKEVFGHLVGELLKRSEKGLSFPPIVASGKNACVLHYNKNDEPLVPSSLMLIDCGARQHSMPADISRTVPVSGVFNPHQKLMYSIVLEAQCVVEKAVKPGATIKQINEICWDYIEDQIKKNITDKGGCVTRAYEKIPHNVSHLMGIMVHDGDPHRNYRDTPLEVGMVVSNEPGFYGEVTLEIEGVIRTEKIGIRIEDDLLITETGCRNLSIGCPKTIEEIERVMA